MPNALLHWTAAPMWFHCITIRPSYLKIIGICSQGNRSSETKHRFRLGIDHDVHSACFCICHISFLHPAIMENTKRNGSDPGELRMADSWRKSLLHISLLQPIFSMKSITLSLGMVRCSRPGFWDDLLSSWQEEKQLRFCCREKMGWWVWTCLTRGSRCWVRPACFRPMEKNIRGSEGL